MAKSKYGILGPISGKLGPVVGGVWNGIPYLRLAEKQAGKKIRSEAQLANELKMSFMNHALVPFHPFINIGFSKLAVGKTALSVAYSVNYHAALKGVYPDFEIDRGKFMISQGPLPGLDSPMVALHGPDRLQLSWGASSSMAARFDDQVMLVVYSAELHLVQGTAGGAIRRDQWLVMVLTNQLVGRALEVYVTVTSFSRNAVSDSVYLGRIEP